MLSTKRATFIFYNNFSNRIILRWWILFHFFYSSSENAEVKEFLKLVVNVICKSGCRNKKYHVFMDHIIVS